MMNQGRNGMYGREQGPMQEEARTGLRADLDLRLRQREYGKILSRMRLSQTCARSLDLYLAAL